MPALAPPDLVAVWEAGARQPEWRRALLALAPIPEGLSEAELRALTLGSRNARLLALRQDTVGPVLRSFVQCPACGEPLEFEATTTELLADYQPPQTDHFAMTHAGCDLECRLLTSEDLATIANLGPAADIQSELLRQVVVSAIGHGVAVAIDDFSPELRAIIAREVAIRDPLSQLAIPIACISCAHVWSAGLEIVPLFWAEIDRAARAILDQVVVLARGYGWGESAIMAMSPQRRAFYVEALGEGLR